LLVFCQAVEREELDFCKKPMPNQNSFFGDVNNSKFDLISEIHEDEFLDNGLDSCTKREEINFDCDYSSINLDISRNTVFWTENTKILNEFEPEDFVLKEDYSYKEPERVILQSTENFAKENNCIQETSASSFLIEVSNFVFRLQKQKMFTFEFG